MAFRYVTQQVVAFIALGLLIAGLVVFFAGRAQGWFESSRTLETVLTGLAADSVLGVTEGAAVELFGTRIGTVRRIAYLPSADATPGYQLHIMMTIRGSLIGFVCPDSRLLIRKTFGVASKTFIQITASRNPQQEECNTPTLTLGADVVPDITAHLERLVRADGPLRQALDNLIALSGNLNDDKERLISDFSELLGGARSVIDNANHVVLDIEQMVSRLDSSESLIGRLTSDPVAADQLTNALTNANGVLMKAGETLLNVDALIAQVKSPDGTLANADNTLGNVDELTDQLGKSLSGVDKAVKSFSATSEAVRKDLDRATEDILARTENLPSLLLETVQLMQQTTELMTALQNTWLLQGRADDQNGGTRLSPSAITTR